MSLLLKLRLVEADLIALPRYSPLAASNICIVPLTTKPSALTRSHQELNSEQDAIDEFEIQNSYQSESAFISGYR